MPINIDKRKSKRPVRVYAVNTAPQSITLADQNINFGTAILDTYGAYSSVVGYFTAPSYGMYLISFSYQPEEEEGSPGTFQRLRTNIFQVKASGGNVNHSFAVFTPNDAVRFEGKWSTGIHHENIRIPGSNTFIIELESGDAVQVRVNDRSGATGFYIATGATLSVEKLNLRGD